LWSVIASGSIGLWSVIAHRCSAAAAATGNSPWTVITGATTARRCKSIGPSSWRQRRPIVRRRRRCSGKGVEVVVVVAAAAATAGARAERRLLLGPALRCRRLWRRRGKDKVGRRRRSRPFRPLVVDLETGFCARQFFARPGTSEKIIRDSVLNKMVYTSKVMLECTGT
jgi:hypothetical protein